MKGKCSFCSEETTVIQGNGNAVCVTCAKELKGQLEGKSKEGLICPSCGVEPPAIFVLFEAGDKRGVLYLVASGFDENEKYIYKLARTQGTWEPNSMPSQAVCKICESNLSIDQLLKNQHVYNLLT